MATGNQRGQRKERVEMPCSSQGCKGVVALTPNRLKWKNGGKLFCRTCIDAGKVQKGRSKTTVMMLCANPQCPQPDIPFPRTGSEAKEGACCSRSCAAQYRAVTGSHKRLTDKKCARQDCPIVFHPATNSQRYCSTECKDLDRRSIDRSPRPCRGCGEELIPTYHNQQYHGHGCRRIRIEHVCEVDFCNEVFSGPPHAMQDKKYCPKHRLVLARMTNAMLDQPWHNGKPKVRVKSKSPNGFRIYVQIWQPDHPNAYSTGWMAEHVWVVCRRDNLDRIPDEYQVHHVDRNGENNDPGNLELLTHAAHAEHTARENALRAAAYDGLMAKLDRAGIDLESLD